MLFINRKGQQGRKHRAHPHILSFFSFNLEEFVSLKPEIGDGEEVMKAVLGEAEVSKLALNFI